MTVFSFPHPCADDQRHALGLLDDTGTRKLESEVGVTGRGLVLDPLGEALDCEFDLIERRPELASEMLLQSTYVRHFSVVRALAEVSTNSSRDSLDIVREEEGQLLEVEQTPGEVLGLVGRERGRETGVGLV